MIQSWSLCLAVLATTFVLCASTAITVAMADGPAVVRASGEDMAVAKEHFRRGQEHFIAGRHRDAVIAFERAHDSWPSPELLFNIARCHEALGERDRAVARYEAYLAAAPAADDAGDVRRRITTLRGPVADREPGAAKVASLAPRVGGFASESKRGGRADARLPNGGKLTARQADAAGRLQRDLQRAAIVDGGPPDLFWAGIGATGLCVVTAATLSALASNPAQPDSLGAERLRMTSGVALGTGLLTGLLSVLILAAD